MKWQHGRATVVTPGKHGPTDYRATINRIAPTLGEYALLLGGKLLAEDRYNGFRQHGRQLYLGYLKKVAQAADMDEVVLIAEQAQMAEGGAGLPGFIRCCKGGKNDCVSLCQDCWEAGYRLPEETVRSTLRWWGLADDENIDDFVEKVRRR
jgi:hypothetical protein